MVFEKELQNVLGINTSTHQKKRNDRMGASDTDCANLHEQETSALTY